MTQPVQAMWFVGLKGTNSTPSPVAHAFGAFAHLFQPDLNVSGDALEFVGPGQGVLIRASELIGATRVHQTMPVWVLGTMTPEEAVRQSWDDMGLNLFELPWGSQQKQRVFRSVPVTSLLSPFHPQSWGVKLFDPVEANDWIQAEKHLQWAKCHQFVSEMTQSVGHGRRDEWLVPEGEDWTQRWNVYKTQLGDILTRALPCDRCNSCHLKTRLSRLLANTPQRRDDYHDTLRAIANATCQRYRLAEPVFSLAQSSSNPSPDKPVRFKRIIILEDNDTVKQELQKRLASWLEEPSAPDAILCADHKKSITARKLRDEQDRDLLKDLKEKKLHDYEILTCFDLELGEEDKVFDIPGGFWLLYKVSNDYPGMPRLVVTAYRSYDVHSFAAGATGYLLKPFTQATVDEAVKNATRLVKMLWIVPKKVQKDYSHITLGTEPVSFDSLTSFLKRFLRQRHIVLEIRKDRPPPHLAARYDVVILDLLKQDEKSLRASEKILHAICSIRSGNPDCHISILLPATDREGGDQLYSENLRRVLHKEKDRLAWKPMWLCAEGSEVPNMAQLALGLIREKPAFNSKYVVLVPIMPLVWQPPTGRPYLDQLITTPPDQIQSIPPETFSPFAVLLAKEYGISARLADIFTDPRLVTRLIERIRLEKCESPKRWRMLASQQMNQLVTDAFLSYIQSPAGNSLGDHGTVERWIRTSIDKAISEILGRKYLTEPLARLFGGETRYELFVRGGWYDADRRVEDVLLAIEFCANSSVVARLFIENTVVKYLKTTGAEEKVLFQEIPMQGFLK